MRCTSSDIERAGRMVEQARRPSSSKTYRRSCKDVTSDQQMLGLQMNVVVDRDAASRLGVSLSRRSTTRLYDAFGQRQVSIFIYTAL